MNAQQLHDYIIKPTLEHMDSLGGNYNTKEARFLLLGTAAIESNCGEFIKQINGPALGIWQMEPRTYDAIWQNCDAVKKSDFSSLITNLRYLRYIKYYYDQLMLSPMYSCAMARLKYAMDTQALPKLTSDKDFINTVFYKYYKRVYNTELGKSTFEKWVRALDDNRIFEVDLGG